MFDAGDLDRVVISPGPGHPTTDSGISREVITWGIGRLPILGVCMGLECLVDILGGEVCTTLLHNQHLTNGRSPTLEKSNMAKHPWSNTTR